MDEIALFFNKFPAWAGSVPMWGVFAMVLITLIKVWPVLRAQTLAERVNMRDRFLARVKELSAEIKTARDECDTLKRKMQEEIDLLKNKLNNEAWQRIQGEISLVHTLIEIVDAPQLKRILDALERRKTTLPPVILEAHHEGAEDNDPERT